VQESPRRRNVVVDMDDAHGKIAERGEGDRKRQLLEKLCARVKPENKPSGRKCAHQLALVPFEDSD
jgi:hypothetical protein